MIDADLKAILKFLEVIEPLKRTYRSAYISDGRHESTAEHSWRLALFAMLVSQKSPEIDALKLLKMCLIHDLGEVINGDIPAPIQGVGNGKSEQERMDLISVLNHLPSELAEEILALWDEYEQATSREAQLAKGLDKLETILQHVQGDNPQDFDYAFNLQYGKAYTDQQAVTLQLRELVDQKTKERLVD
jgi:putative hydrolase of HD superfamily